MSIIDEEDHCFFWRSDFPSQVFYDVRQVEGSGSDMIMQILDRTIDHPFNDRPDLGPIGWLLVALGFLMSNEPGAAPDKSLTYGVAYEGLVRQDDRFIYVSTVTYFTFYVINNLLNIAMPIFKYESFCGYALMWRYYLEKVGDSDAFSPGWDVTLLLPPGLQPKDYIDGPGFVQQHLQAIKKQRDSGSPAVSWEADYYAALVYHDHGDQRFPHVIVQPADMPESERYLSVKGTSFELAIDTSDRAKLQLLKVSQAKERKLP